LKKEVRGGNGTTGQENKGCGEDEGKGDAERKMKRPLPLVV